MYYDNRGAWLFPYAGIEHLKQKPKPPAEIEALKAIECRYRASLTEAQRLSIIYRRRC